MALDLDARLLQRAGQYLRTAHAAQANGDTDAAFENARTAAELAAKSMLAHAGVRYGADHNVSGTLVRAGLWPRSRAAPLSKLLGEFVRGVYGFTNEVRPTDAARAIRLAGSVLEAAHATSS